MRQGPGQHGNAYWFDGTNDKVEVADSDSLDVTGDLTVEAWISTWGMGSRVIAAKWGDAGQRSYQLRLQDDKLVGSLSANGTDAVSVTSAGSVWGGTHVAMRLRGTELSLWIGGMKDTQTVVFNGPIHKSTAPLGIAWQADPNAPGWFSGTIDEVRVSRFARGVFGNPTLTYDDNGNLTSDGDLKFSYDFLNRLVRVRRAADDSLLAVYAYDALGRRVLKVDHSPLTTHLTRYIYDTYDVIAEYDGSDALEARYILGRGIDQPLVMDRRDIADLDGDENRTEFQRLYYHTNHLGTVAALTWWDEAAEQEKPVEDYSYDAYGFVSVVFHAPSSLVPSPSSLVANPYTFTGRALDAETGLMYYRARYYSTTLGRFISRDPIGYVDGMNLYAAYFVPGGSDPLGLECPTAGSGPAAPAGGPVGPIGPNGQPKGMPNGDWKWVPSTGDAGPKDRGGKWHDMDPKHMSPKGSRPEGTWEGNAEGKKHWDHYDGQKNKTRWDVKGRPVSPYEAHTPWWRRFLESIPGFLEKILEPVFIVPYPIQIFMPPDPDVRNVPIA
jgi:RHS repeat-associated protein